MKSRVSVVIPTYNGSRFIRETLQSVFAQTRRPDEIVIVDDASTDDTPSIVKALAAEAAMPLRLIELPTNTGGPATPMNVGIEAATGDLIALLDHDDLMSPEKLSAQGAVLENYPNLELVLGDYRLLVRNHLRPRTVVWPWESSSCGYGGNPALHMLEPAVSRRVIGSLGVSCSNLVFRKALWCRLGGFSGEAGIACDFDFLLRASDREIGWLASVLFTKRNHGGNLWRETPKNVLLVLKINERWLRAEAENLDDGTYNELRALGVAWPVELAWEMHWLRKWDEFDQLRQALRDYSDVPSVKHLLEFTPYPRWLYAIRDLLRTMPRRLSQTRDHG